MRQKCCTFVFCAKHVFFIWSLASDHHWSHSHAVYVSSHTWITPIICIATLICSSKDSNDATMQQCTSFQEEAFWYDTRSFSFIEYFENSLNQPETSYYLSGANIFEYWARYINPRPSIEKMISYGYGSNIFLSKYNGRAGGVTSKVNNDQLFC